jgi:HSP20 family protein
MPGDWSNIGTSLFGDFRRLEEEMDAVFGRWPWSAGIRSVVRGSYPPVNVGATPDQVDVYLFAAGLDPKTLDISMQDNLLTVAGERKAPTEQSVDYYRKERFDGEFRRAIELPDDVDPDQVDARYRDGLLHIRVQQRKSDAILHPAVDIHEDAQGITLLADMPGVSRERLNLHVENDALVVEGEAGIETPEGMEALYADVRSTRYRRSFALSGELQTDAIDASLRDGVLRVRIPKRAEVQPRRIEVRVE